MEKLKDFLCRHPYKTAAVCGLLLAASYPPLPLGFLSSVAWVPMFILADTNTVKKTFRLFFTFGLVCSLGLLYWIGNNIAPGLWHMILIGLAALCAYFALYYGLAGIYCRLVHKTFGTKGIFFFAPFWVLLEYLKSIGEISFPWATLAYTWGSYLIPLQALSIFGVYFYSLLILMISILIYLAIKLGWRNRVVVGSLCGIGLVSIFLVIFGLASIRSEKPPEDVARVSIIQANIDQLEKWDDEFMDSAFIKHEGLTLESFEKKQADLVIWSETSLPMYFLKRFRYISRLKELFDSLNVPVLFGSLDYNMIDGKYSEFEFFNCAFYYEPDNKAFEKYMKIRLVPFSEYLPFTGVVPILSMVDLGEADFSPGDSMMILKRGTMRFAPSICYEIIYPSFIRKSVNKGANLLVNITNDGWFGRTPGPFQHLNVAKFRCIENRVWLARCANSGISAIVDSKGAVRRKTGLMKEAYLNGEVKLMRLSTFYSRNGDLVLIPCLIAFLLSLVGIRLARKS